MMNNQNNLEAIMRDRINLELLKRRENFFEIAKKCEISKYSIYRWCNGKILSTESIALLAMQLHTTVDYISGRTEQPITAYLAEEKIDAEEIRFSFLCRWNDLIEEHNLTARKVARVYGFSKNSYYNWKNNLTLPKLDKLYIIAEDYSLSLDYLLGLTEIKDFPIL